MAQETLVSKLRNMSDKILADKKSVSLIMLLGNNTSELTTAFDFIISAKWLNNYDQDKGIDIVLDYLYDNLNVDELENISRVTIIHTSDIIVQNINRNARISYSVSKINDCIFGNLIIPYAIIFESNFEND